MEESKLTYPGYVFNKYDGLKPREKSILNRAQYVILTWVAQKNLKP